MDLHARGGIDNRPRLRLRRPLALPLHHRDARASPFRIHNSLLSCGGSHRGHQTSHGSPLPRGYCGRTHWVPEELVEVRPLVPVGRAEYGSHGVGEGYTLLQEQKQSGCEAAEALRVQGIPESSPVVFAVASTGLEECYVAIDMPQSR